MSVGTETGLVIAGWYMATAAVWCWLARPAFRREKVLWQRTLVVAANGLLWPVGFALMMRKVFGRQGSGNG